MWISTPAFPPSIVEPKLAMLNQAGYKSPNYPPIRFFKRSVVVIKTASADEIYTVYLASHFKG
jgi:hypothetical protein